MSTRTLLYPVAAGKEPDIYISSGRHKDSPGVGGA